ncbi:MAG TPA: nucleotidyl transferase AbiEii/AbiGii toxin family protein [Epsilonproteobacteria bacterium]|nr:nucleotidyl transferase AbiEii/AbiGii toxin family protein [Campylobacterota bacterium]
MDRILNLEDHEREELFNEAAVKMNVHPAIVEKDFWVVWVLSKIFSEERLKKVLMFKGGTSLSKVFNLIGRFSEDIDLILDWREVTEENPAETRESRNQQNRLNEEINTQAVEYIKGVLLPAISELVAPKCTCSIDEEDGHNIIIAYPAAFSEGYLRPQILLEIGPLASWLPSSEYEISAYAVEQFPTLFDVHTCKVHAIDAKRTFWEKATILHQEANRGGDKPLPLRYSRHYYDLALMARSEVKDKALADLELLENVVAFKKQFYYVAWANYEEAVPGSFKLLPHDSHIDELKKDYKAMQNMIFDKQLSFEEIMETLENLEKEINILGK